MRPGLKQFTVIPEPCFFLPKTDAAEHIIETYTTYMMRDHDSLKYIYIYIYIFIIYV